MTWAYIIAAAVGIGVVTILCRSSFFLLPARFQLPPRIEQALRYAPACALAAIIAPGILTDSKGSITVDLSNPRLYSVIVASVFFAFKRNMLLMMIVGMITFTVLRLTIG